MDDSDDQQCPSGAPAWVMTFADLMSLLMCFFVLLLSFATMDATRFKKMAESFKDAFGVQKEIPVYEVIQGTSVIAQHFSPGTVDPTPLDEIRQSTTEELKNLNIPEDQKKKILEEMETAKKQKLEAEANEIRESLQDEIKQGLISVEVLDPNIVIRIHEKGSFPSGSAELNLGFGPVMQKLVETVDSSSRDVIVAGHTDNIPILTEWYRSNWELSASRAVTVVHSLLLDGRIDPNRLVVEGRADTMPLVPNDSGENRSKNRRVELILVERNANDDLEEVKGDEYP